MYKTYKDEEKTLWGFLSLVKERSEMKVCQHLHLDGITIHRSEDLYLICVDCSLMFLKVDNTINKDCFHKILSVANLPEIKCVSCSEIYVQTSILWHEDWRRSLHRCYLRPMFTNLQIMSKPEILNLRYSHNGDAVLNL